MVKLPFEKQEKKPLVNVNKLIDKGAPLKDEQKENPKKWTKLCLRIPDNLLEEIDVLVDNTVGITRTGWILQTLQKEVSRLRESEEVKD